jgi:DNA polymerase III subunit delta
MKKQLADSRRTQTDFLRQIGAGEFAPLYLLEGAESLLRENALKTLINRAVDSELRDFNVTTLSAAGGDVGAVLEVAGQLPMMASRRVVIVRGFESINDEGQIAALERYLANPNPSTTVVFVSDALDQRRAISSLLKRFCTYVSFQPLEQGQDAVSWIADYISQQTVTIARQDAALLVETVGFDLRRLASEADKLAAYVGEGGRIQRSHIDELVLHTKEHTNFDISNAVRDGNRERALRLLDQVFSGGNDRGEAPAVLGAIAAAFRRLVSAKELMAEGLSPEEMARAMGGNPYGLRSTNERARKVDRDWLLHCLELIAETDVAVKSSLGTPRLQLEFLICELCPVVGTRRK